MNRAVKTQSRPLFQKLLFACQVVRPWSPPSRLLLLLVALIATTPLVAAQVKFKTPATYPAGSPSWIAAGDLNGDGNMDIIATDFTHSDIVVLLGKGDGTLQPAMTYHMTVAPYRLITGDFNRDGKLDVIVANPNPPNGTFSVLFGNGDGTFQTPVNYAVNTSQMRAADFNGDGYLDLAILGTGIQVLLNNGDGTFRLNGSYSFQSPRVLATADLNGDGKTDLMVVSTTQNSNKTVNTVSVLLGKGDGTFQPQIDSDASTLESSTGPYGIVVADFDRDGKLDVALSDETLKILKGNGDGTFKPPSVHFRLGNTSTELKPGDFNGDGKIDLVTTGVFGTGALQLLLGNGDGTFLDAGNQIGGSNSSSTSVAVADLNGDTRPDLLSNFGGGLTVALVNATPGNVDNTDYFVHQQYEDFLNREPDANGFGFWTNEITSCGADIVCQQIKRINVSAAFYLSIEFQQTAYLVERLYKVSYGDATGSSSTNGIHQLPVPIVRLNDLLVDALQIGDSIIVNQPGWDTALENNKQQFVNQFVQRARFASAFPSSLTPAAFVDRLNQNAGNVLSPSDRVAAIGLFGTALDSSNTSARAAALRQVAENSNLYRLEFNRAFVLMQYFGYLRRNPNEGQDTDYTGYELWLNKLNSFNGNFVNAEMVKAFITSTEYKNRFTQ